MSQHTPSNPFFHRGRPIRDEQYFFGRLYETNKALGLLRHGQSLSVIGPRRIGKTSFLNHLMRALRSGTESAEHATTYLCLSVDGTLLNMLTAADIFNYLFDEIADLAAAEALNFPPAAAGPLAAVMSAVRTLNRHGTQLIIFIDEFEALSQNSHLDAAFFSQLRGLSMQFEVTFVTASAQPLLSLTYAQASVLSSPFFNIFAPIQLGLFASAEAEQLLTALSTQANAPFSAELVSTQLDWAGPHPLLLQIAAFYTFEARVEQATPTPDLTNAYRLFQQNANSHWLYAWKQLNTDAQRLLILLSSSEASNLGALHTLENSALIVRKNDKPQLLSAGFADFVARQPVDGVVQVPPFTLVVVQRLVLLRGKPLPMAPTEFRLLQTLLNHADQVVTYQRLSEQVWPDEPQHEPDMERIKTSVKMLRRALAADRNCIQNVARSGYRFVSGMVAQ